MPISYQSALILNPNDYKCLMQTDTRLPPLLWRENQQLKQQLRDAQLVINTLRSEIDILRKQLAKYQAQCTSQSSYRKAPTMHIQEHFQWSSEEETDLSPKNTNSRVLNLNFSASFANSSPLSKRLNRMDTDRSMRTVNGGVKSQNNLFKRQSNSRPIFECFFVTGITPEGPCISYCYPQGLDHSFEGYLSLMYGETILRTDPLSPRKKQGEVRELFVIPIIKEEGRSSDKNYLIVCEVEQAALGPDLAGLLFPRYYCFLSQWKFFKEFRSLISQLTNLITTRRKDCNELSESHFGLLLQQQAENFLRSLRQKNTNFNTTVDCLVGGLRFTADVPAEGLSFQLVKNNLEWGVAKSQVQVRGEEGTTQLLGLMLAYTIMQKKLLLFSAVKSKVSQAVIQLLEALRPLAFAGPVLVAALREQHENYLDAPVPLIMGLWAEQRRPSRQKIEIFMNRKLDLLGLIEKAKLEVPDGLIINLDTGLAFGGAADPQLNAWAARLNTYRMGLSEGQSYHLLGKLISQQCEQSRALWSQVRDQVQGTQMYCYYRQQAEQ